MGNLKIYFCCGAAALLCGAFVGQEDASAQGFSGQLGAELDRAADAIIKVMSANGHTQVRIGQIVPTENAASNGGPGIKMELMAALERRQHGCVSNQAKLMVSGAFRPVDSNIANGDGSRNIVELLTLDLSDDNRRGRRIETIEAEVRRLRDIAALEGASLVIDPDDDEREQNKQLRRRLENPTADPPHIDDRRRIHPRAGSPYALSIKAMPKDMPNAKGQFLPATLDDQGCPRVEIDKGQCYELVFFNDSLDEAAISVKIDGIDVFAFSEDRDPETGQPRSTRYVTPPQGSTTIYGWYKTGNALRTDNFQRFLVTEYGRGAASQMPSEALSRIGMITVAVSRSHVPGAGRARGGAETGFGPPVQLATKRIERIVDPPHEFITVRYLR